MQNLIVSLVQTDLYWQDITANLAMLEEKIWSLTRQTDLIILPEMFTTGFTMDVESLAEPMNLTTFKWMKQMAAQTGAVITGSYIVKAAGNYYNRLVWMRPDGTFETYDKRHLFRMADENKVFSAGDKKLICNLNGWKISPFICYDLRFPVWSRNSKTDMVDLMIYVANWPEKRIHAWNTLLQARAIENSCYVIGVNRLGDDGKEIHYSGESAIIEPKGEPLYHKKNIEDIYTYTLVYEDLYKYRKTFPSYLDADDFEVIFKTV